MLRSAHLSALATITLVTPCLNEPFKTTGTINAYFSPGGGLAKAIVKEIDSAKEVNP